MNIEKARKAKAKKLMNKPWNKFQPINLATAQHVPHWMTRAYTNNHCVVMINDKAPTSHGEAVCAMIKRHDGRPVHNWRKIQNIKNEIFGENTIAVEYYPPESKLIDHFNLYWLWVFPEGVIPEPSSRF